MPNDADPIRHEQHGGTIVLTARDKRSLLEHALLVDLAEVELNGADRTALDLFAREVARDLLREIGLDIDGSDSTQFAIPIAITGRQLLSVNVAAEGLAARLRGATPRRAVHGRPLALRSDALGKTVISLEAILGRGALTLRELDDIAPGDVVLLDRSAQDGAELVLAGDRAAITRGALGRSGDKPSLYL